jgi:hypothetical protein
MDRSNRVSRLQAPRRIAWRAIAIVGAATTALAGCAFAMQGPDPNWDGKQKPDCAESYAPVVVDAFTSSVIASTAVELALDDKVNVPAEVTLAAIGVSLVYAASAASGARKYNACRTTTARWRASEAVRERDAGAAVVASPAYFCVRSPSQANLEICMRERSRCEHARETMGLSRGEYCAPHAAAWCFDPSGAERCFATQDACDTQLTKVRGEGDECSERR